MGIERLRPSRFTHLLPVEGGYTALYNALNMGLAFADNEELTLLRENNWSCEEAPELSQLIKRLKEEGLLVDIEYDDLGDVRRIKEQLPSLPVAILYLLLTKECNFACRYCFVGGGALRQSAGVRMAPEVAKDAIDLFAKTLKDNPKGKLVHPRVIFYGGEPLIDFKTMLFSLEYIEQLKRAQELPSELALTLNTNASIVNEKIAGVLAKYDVAVAVSVDGIREVHDKERVYQSGRGTFDRTIRGFHILKNNGVKVSISCTVTESGVHQLEEALNFFINELGVTTVGFNIVKEGEGARLSNPDAYDKAATEALVKCFKIAREKGVYEDRMMRKVRAMVQRTPHLNDCAGCGQQIVVEPGGWVGVCHAGMNTKTFFTPNTPNLDPQTHPIWTEWRKRSPFNFSECLDCIALSTCGGGCPYEIYVNKGSIWEIDRRFCTHSKMAVEFLIRDLWDQIRARSV